MATKPSDIVEWNTGGSNNIEPSGGVKIAGWANGDIVPSSTLNWFMKLAGEWTAYLDELVSTVNTWTAVQTHSAKIEMTADIEMDASHEYKFDPVRTYHTHTNPAEAERVWVSGTGAAANTGLVLNFASNGDTVIIADVAETIGIATRFRLPVGATITAVEILGSSVVSGTFLLNGIQIRKNVKAASSYTGTAINSGTSVTTSSGGWLNVALTAGPHVVADDSLITFYGILQPEAAGTQVFWGIRVTYTLPANLPTI